MLDPNNQHYFALDEAPPKPLPWWRVRAHQMQVLGVLGVVIGVAIVGYYGYQMYSLTHVDGEKIEQANQIIERAAENCEAQADREACEDRARAEAARTTGQVSVCDGLEGGAFTNCVSLIALDTADAEVCAVLSGSNETSCQDGATLIAAQRAQSYAACASIIDESLRTSCQLQLRGTVIANGECEKYGIAKEECDYPAKLAAIIALGNPQGCAQLSSDQKAGCEDAFTSLDQDRDNLVLAEEYRLGTSDTNADTDGDGYTDGEEVKSGHDPLK
jgi:hypothetical protein